VKATIEKDMNMVFKLQRQILKSFKARALAIRLVTSTGGSKTSGIDNII
jgi:hypothetical protein